MQQQTPLKLPHNSPPPQLLTIKLLAPSPPKTPNIPHIILSTLKNPTPPPVLKKRHILKPLLLTTKSPVRRSDRSYIKFHQNPSLIIPHHKAPPPTPIFAPLPPQLPQANFMKILSLPPQVL
ncbi:uL14 family ribosomal protein [Staphylococcus hominis]|uniref:uL14 family ribosomal protein n=1 Tax=Staphylococcus hominis TaxID=1290 RepID=UPI003709956C